MTELILDTDLNEPYVALNKKEAELIAMHIENISMDLSVHEIEAVEMMYQLSRLYSVLRDFSSAETIKND